MVEFKPLNLAALYQGADAAVGQAMQMNLMAMQASRMKQEFDEEDTLRQLARTNTTTDPATGATTMDLKSFTRGAYSVNPLKAIGFEKAAAEAEKSSLERANLQGQIDERRIKQSQDRLKLMGDASTSPYLEWKKLTDGGMPDDQARQKVQPLYEAALRNLVGSGLFTDQQMQGMKILQTPQFDPVVAKTGMDQAVGAGKQLEQYLADRQPKSDLGKLKADFDAKKIDKATYDAAVAKAVENSDWTYDAERAILVNKKTGATKAVDAPGGGALPPKTADVEGLRKEFNNREEVKNYNAAIPVLRAVAKAPDTAAGDLDFIYGVGKILDPGSVVREGEMALVMKSGTPLQRIIGQTRWSAEQGGRLSPAQRAQLMEALQGRVNELHTAATDARKPFEAQAKRQNIPLEETLTLPELPQLGGKGKGKAAAKAPAVGHVEEGFRFKGGDPSKPENWEKVS